MDKNHVIQFFSEAGKPLKQNSIDAMEDYLDYSVFTSICRICSHQSVDIVPTDADLDNLECGNCGNMSCQPAMPDEELEDYQLKDGFNKHRFFVS